MIAIMSRSKKGAVRLRKSAAPVPVGYAVLLFQLFDIDLLPNAQQQGQRQLPHR
jgi:hypothetical protein